MTAVRAKSIFLTADLDGLNTIDAAEEAILEKARLPLKASEIPYAAVVGSKGTPLLILRYEDFVRAVRGNNAP